jgi:hypothetical protein
MNEPYFGICPRCKEEQFLSVPLAIYGMVCIYCLHDLHPPNGLPRPTTSTQKRYERDHQMIGRWQVFLRGDDADVIVQCIVFDGYEERLVEYNFTAEGALKLLAWLSLHKDELSQAVQKEDME